MVLTLESVYKEVLEEVMRQTWLPADPQAGLSSGRLPTSSTAIGSVFCLPLLFQELLPGYSLEEEMWSWSCVDWVFD